MAAAIALLMVMLVAALILGIYETAKEHIHWFLYRRKQRKRRLQRQSWCR